MTVVIDLVPIALHWLESEVPADVCWALGTQQKKGALPLPLGGGVLTDQQDVQ